MDAERADGLDGDVMGGGDGATECAGDLSDIAGGTAEDDRCDTTGGVVIETDCDGEHMYQTMIVKEVRISREVRAGEPSVITVILNGGGIIFLYPEHIVQFSLGESLRPGATWEVKKSLWPNGGIEDIRVAA